MKKKIIKGRVINDSNGNPFTTIFYENAIGYTRCQRCGRRLKNPEHMEIGYGPVCFKKVNSKKQQRRLF